MSQPNEFEAVVKTAALAFDAALEEFNEMPGAVAKTILFPLYDEVLNSLLEAAAVIKMQYIQLYAAGIAHQKEEQANIGPDSLIDPYKANGK